MEPKENLKKVSGKREDNKKLEQFSLPNSDIISEWFSQDCRDRLKKIFRSNNYSKYSVYEVYKEKGAL